MAVLYVRLPDDLRDTLRARAEAEGRSMSNLAVWLMRQQLEEPMFRPSGAAEGEGMTDDQSRKDRLHAHALAAWAGSPEQWRPLCRCGWTVTVESKRQGRYQFSLHKRAQSRRVVVSPPGDDSFHTVLRRNP